MHWLDPDYLPLTTGIVARFLLNPHGELDGMVLDDDTLIHFPPHLSAAVERAVRPGDTVSVRGVKPRGAPVVVAVAVLPRSGKAIVDEGPDGRPHPPHHGPHHHGPPHHRHPGHREPMPVSGVVRLTLYAPKGEVCGALLEDGTILRLGPKEAQAEVKLFRPGIAVAACGPCFSTPHGCVVDVHELGTSGKTLRPVKGPKAHKDKKHPPPHPHH